MIKFTNLQKITNLHKNAESIFMQLFCIKNHLFLARQILAGQDAGQRDMICPSVDFKGVSNRDKRDITASAGSGTQPPLPPLGGRGLSHLSRPNFYSSNIHMQCQRTGNGRAVKAAKIYQ
ncbi:MAG: hypothetical protein QRY16_21105 [Enterobacterales bacterium endosymbiont of Blomia tropicalis]|uniref:hypothetical protein n=1 Tax=Mixta mediterraneensis TaxID=2758443 RepID=UPI0025A6AD7D|nr:hypothetical protein [Mixta mediterraneensis]MDL4916166.1 hypothetical protein [Mixta mediterraneensis]